MLTRPQTLELAAAIREALARGVNNTDTPRLEAFDAPEARVVATVLSVSARGRRAGVHAMRGALAIRRIELSRPRPWLAAVAIVASATCAMLVFFGELTAALEASLASVVVSLLLRTVVARRAEVSLLQTESLCRLVLSEISR